MYKFKHFESDLFYNVYKYGLFMSNNAWLCFASDCLDPVPFNTIILQVKFLKNIASCIRTNLYQQIDT